MQKFKTTVFMTNQNTNYYEKNTINTTFRALRHFDNSM